MKDSSRIEVEGRTLSGRRSATERMRSSGVVVGLIGRSISELLHLIKTL